MIFILFELRLSVEPIFQPLFRSFSKPLLKKFKTSREQYGKRNTIRRRHKRSNVCKFSFVGNSICSGGCDGLSIWKVGSRSRRPSPSSEYDFSISYFKFVCAGSRNGSIKMYVRSTRTTSQLYLLKLTHSQFNHSNLTKYLTRASRCSNTGTI